jgi:hypothetical protein
MKRKRKRMMRDEEKSMSKIFQHTVWRRSVFHCDMLVYSRDFLCPMSWVLEQDDFPQCLLMDR